MASIGTSIPTAPGTAIPTTVTACSMVGRMWHRPLSTTQDATASASRTVQVERDLLAKNDSIAAENRRAFADRGVFALNLVSSPGSGKTTLLVKTIGAWEGRTPVAVIEGDQQTSRDADRVREAGARAVQINTGKGCHLDAQMVAYALSQLALADDSLLLIENVGNLVCPAAFDLGEAHKVVVLSVTEGDDKPLKYPDMFHAADLARAEQDRPLAARGLRRRGGDRLRAPRSSRNRRDNAIRSNR